MADITIKNTLSGTTAAGPLMENFYEPAPIASPQDTFEVINGYLDNANLNSGVDLDRHVIQPRTFTQAQQVGGTVALDFFDSLFLNVTYKANEDVAGFGGALDDESRLVPIPGGGIRFELKWDARILILVWNICWANDLRASGEYSATTDPNVGSPVYLGLDGTLVTSTRRVVAASALAQADIVGGSPTTGEFIRGVRMDNQYTGHHLSTTLLAGWHTAQLYIGLSDQQSIESLAVDIAQQARVRVRSMRPIAFR